MPPLAGVVLNWHSLIARHAKDIKTALHKAARAIDAQIAGRSQGQLQPVLARNTPKQPLHPLARIRQSQSRFYSTVRRQFSSTPGRVDRASLPKSRNGTLINQSTGRAPFASTLRPNLSGGALGRTAGGYTLGSGRVGGARYFSHGPAAQAQVVQNVSQAMRAFLIGGNKAQFDGVSSRTGEKQFKTVSTVQQTATQTLRSVTKATPGSWIDFSVNPTITALTPLQQSFALSTSLTAATHLNSEGLIDLLSVDFSRALKDLVVTLNDIKKLAVLGDLPITQQGHNVRVHFPGCDAATVERLCEELSIQRGTVGQDSAFDSFVGAEMALLFPFAPSCDTSDVGSMFETASPAKRSPLIRLEELLSPSDSPDDFSTHSACSDFQDIVAEDAYLSSPSAFESIRSDSQYGDRYSPLEYQGIEGIYRFIEQCDSARR